MPPVIANRYQIDTTLGTGGMGVVFRATDTQTGKIVALKQLRADLAENQPEMFERFAREAEALRQLNHPNIVQALDTFEMDGERYIVMEYVPGDDLSVILEREGRLPVNHATRIAIEITDALTRAHYLKIIHRDLKPANVLILPDGSARLTDFGLAHLEQKERVTRAGLLLGTPDYLPPEAFNAESTDERGDIWALGVMLFEMLTGQHPFSAESLPTLMVNVLIQPTPDLETLCPEAPVALVDLVYRMLEKDRAARISSARLVGAGLEAVMHRGTTTPISTGLGTATSRSARFNTPTPVSLPLRHNLPAQTTPFIGREAEVEHLQHLINDPMVRLITLLGPGGMGKSRLAIESGLRLVEQHPETSDPSRFDRGIPFPDGVIFVSLSNISHADSIVPAMADAAGFRFYASDAPKQQLLEFLREKAALVIFDNCEHLLNDLGLISEILQAAPDVTLVATSRARLNLQGETLMVIEGMDFPVEPTADPGRYSAVQLFIQSARRSKPGFDLKPQDYQAVAQICRIVRGMPLGIELAAAWVEMLSMSEIAAEIAKDIDFLETEAHDTPERHRSLRAVFDHSWELLTSEEKQTFERLSVFRGRFTRRAGQTITGATLRQLMALVNKSLIRRDPDTGIYQIHEMMRQFAAEKLAESGKVESVHTRHSEYYIRALTALRRDLQGRKQIEARADIDADLENVRASWTWAAEHGLGEPLADSVHALGIFFDMHAQYLDCHAMFEPVASALAKFPPDHGRDRALGWLYSWLSLSQLMYRQVESAHEYVELAREAVQRSKDPEGRAMLDFISGMEERIAGDPILSRDHFKRSAAEFSALNMAWDRAHCLVNLASASYFRCEATQTDVGMGIIAAEEALAISDTLGDLYLRAHTLEERGHLAIMIEDHERGIGWIEEAILLHRRIGNSLGMASALQETGWGHLLAGRFGEARSAATEALALYREAGNIAGMVAVQALRTRIEFFAGEFHACAEYAREFVALSLRVDLIEWRIAAYAQLGRALWAVGDLSGCEEAFRSGYFEAEDQQRREDMCITLTGITLVLLTQRRFEDASVCLDTMRLLSESGVDYNQIAVTHSFAGRLAHMQGRHEDALTEMRTAYELLTDPSRVRNSYNWDEGLRTEFISLTQQGIAEAERALGRLNDARKHLRDALNTALRFRYPPHLLSALTTAARLFVAEGNYELAGQMLALISENPQVYAVERYRAAALLARIRTELDDDTFTDVVTRGMSLTPEDAVRELMRTL